MMFPLFQSKEKFSLGKFSASQFCLWEVSRSRLKFLPFHFFEKQISNLISEINSCDVKFLCVDLNIDHLISQSDVFKLFQTCTVLFL